MHTESCPHCDTHPTTELEESLDPPRVWTWTARCGCAEVRGCRSEERALDELDREAEELELADTVPEWSEVG